MKLIIGDFVRQKEFDGIEDEVFQLENSHFHGVSKRNKEFFENLELWTPKYNEWVVVYEKSERNFFAVIKYSEYYEKELKENINNKSIIQPFLNQIPQFFR